MLTLNRLISEVEVYLIEVSSGVSVRSEAALACCLKRGENESQPDAENSIYVRLHIV